jgi:NAD(P)-dependent dehydrogenase (short-subunit alcohol dehydrogenase family)
MSDTARFEIDGAHALVTGGGSGIGAAIAWALSGAGARVSVLGRTERTLSDVLERLPNKGAAVVADVTENDSSEAALTSVTAHAGDVDILINNAGAVETAAFGRIDNEHWQRLLAVNLTSVFTMTRAVIGPMLKRGSGRIVNIASTAGLKGYAYVAAYCAAKHGVIGLTRALASETAQTGITVNAICPGYTDTGLLDRSARAVSEKTGQSEAGLKAQYASANPQNRLIDPQEVAAAALYLCGHEARGLTGQALSLSGGEIMS